MIRGLSPSPFGWFCLAVFCACAGCSAPLSKAEPPAEPKVAAAPPPSSDEPQPADAKEDEALCGKVLAAPEKMLETTECR